MFRKATALTAGLVSAFALPAEAGCRVDISDFVGWTIIYSGTVTGYIDEYGREQHGFEGCEYGRVLIVDYAKQVTCADYSYSYSYFPDIVVISNGFRRKACINGDMHDIQR